MLTTFYISHKTSIRPTVFHQVLYRSTTTLNEMFKKNYVLLS